MPSELEKELNLRVSTLEDIDASMYRFIDSILNLHTNTNKGFEKVPVLWVGSERAFQIKNNRDYRDSVGKLRLPLISIERTSLEKDKAFKGSIQAHNDLPNDGERTYRGGQFKLVSILNQEKTRELQSIASQKFNGQENYPKDGKRYVYDDYYIPLPVYVKVMYSITLRTEYQQQMNDLVVPFISRPGQINHFLLKQEGKIYEGFVETYDSSNNLNNLGEEERKFETKVTIKVLGYVTGAGFNEERPKVIKKQSFVEIKLPRERIASQAEVDDVFGEDTKNKIRVTYVID
tara:strand:+ start:685 stop:1554 length:870 start_codon:yes stop_codon:yes gene_type:complete